MSEVHLNLGFLKQVLGDASAARTEYLAALVQNRFETSALSNLAVLDARSGDVNGAMELLRKAITSDPTRTAAGLNLAFLECKLGHIAEARNVTARLHEFNPDSPELAAFLRTGSYGGQRCDAIRNTETPVPLRLDSLH